MNANSELLRPKAPTDPDELPRAYLLLDALVEGKPAGAGCYTDPYYLSGRVEAKLSSILPGFDVQTAGLLQTAAGFADLVEYIGISAIGTEEDWRTKTMGFVLAGGEGNVLTLSAEVPCNGTEVRIPVPMLPAGTKGELSVAELSFPIYMMASVTITLYLKAGTKVPALVPEKPADFSSPAYGRLLERSLLAKGNTARLARAARRAAAGEDVTIAFIGGSITQGAAAKPIGTASYPYLAYEAFARRFTGNDRSHVHLVRAGVGGTSSELGVARYERDLLRHGTVTPDVVVIEFAVNDLGDETEGEAYESLIYKAMEGPGKPAVILLFSVFMDDWNLEERLAPIGRHHDLPMVSIRRAVVEQFYDKEPVITKRQFFYDLYHPTNEGHRLMADCLDNLFAQVDVNEEGEADPAEMPLLGSWLKNVRTVTRDTLPACTDVRSFAPGGFTGTDTDLQCVQKDELSEAFPEFTDNWMYTGGEELCLSLTCRDLLLLTKDTGSDGFGTATVFVDGQEARRIDPHEVGWTHCNAFIVLRGGESATHELKIQVEEGKHFTLLGFAYTR